MPSPSTRLRSSTSCTRACSIMHACACARTCEDVMQTWPKWQGNSSPMRPAHFFRPKTWRAGGWGSCHLGWGTWVVAHCACSRPAHLAAVVHDLDRSAAPHQHAQAVQESRGGEGREEGIQGHGAQPGQREAVEDKGRVHVRQVHLSTVVGVRQRVLARVRPEESPMTRQDKAAPPPAPPPDHHHRPSLDPPPG
jgi:hypothetical protein